MHHRNRQETENTFLFHNFDLILDHLCEINFIGLGCQFPFKNHQILHIQAKAAFSTL